MRLGLFATVNASMIAKMSWGNLGGVRSPLHNLVVLDNESVMDEAIVLGMQRELITRDPHAIPKNRSLHN
jgi:hypothetical protein